MEIAIIGCSHSLNTGVDLDKTLYNINNGMVAETANNGYGAILANRFPKHNFTLFPAIGGGNKEILQSLTFAIEQKKYDMYIVQTTSWFRYVLGVLNYTKKYFDISKNVKAYIFDTNSYDNQRCKIDVPHYPNFYYSFLPCQNTPIKGTGWGKFLFEDDRCPEGLENMQELYENITKVIVYDHFSSSLFLDENYMIFNIIHLLSQNNNIWYFYWDPPLGEESNFKFVVPEQRKKALLIQYKKLVNNFKNKNHSKLIQEKSISSYFKEKFGEKKFIVDFIKDAGTHISQEGHNIVVDYLLENKKFKEQLWI